MALLRPSLKGQFGADSGRWPNGEEAPILLKNSSVEKLELP
jgi:hypothetical protein